MGQRLRWQNGRRLSSVPRHASGQLARFFLIEALVIFTLVSAGAFLVAHYAQLQTSTGNGTALAAENSWPASWLATDDHMPVVLFWIALLIIILVVSYLIAQRAAASVRNQANTAEQAFRTVVEESPDLKVLVQEGTIEYANPAAAHFFGLQPSDLVCAHPQTLFSRVRFFDETGASLELRVAATRAREETIRARCVIDGQPDRWIELSIAAVGMDSRNYVISARNITEERRLEDLRTEVMSLVSHDLRSPLTVVRGYLDILDRDIPQAQRRRAIDAARLSAEHMEQLLDDLLHATRAERVLAPRVMRPTNLGELATSVATSLQLTAEQEIIVAAEPDVTVLGDPTRLRQAITNLVGNAIKHGPQEGRIRISVTCRDMRAFVAVADDGPGIPKNQWETLFERGTRGEKAREKPGLGLGLYVVRVVAEAHNGSAYIEAEDGFTRFVIELPATDQRAL